MNRATRARSVLALVFLLASACGGGSSSAPPAAATTIREDVSAEQAFDLVQQNAGNPTFVVLDVRTPGEYAAGHLEDSVNLDLNSATFEADVGALARDDTYLVYCGSGGRSAQALDTMAAMGFTVLYNLRGGIAAWTGAGYAIVP